MVLLQRDRFNHLMANRSEIDAALAIGEQRLERSLEKF